MNIEFEIYGFDNALLGIHFMNADWQDMETGQTGTTKSLMVGLLLFGINIHL